MKKRCFVIFLLFAIALICLAACNDTNNYEGQAKITFELEGGDYNNCKLPVIHYYAIPQGQSAKISDMVALSKGELTRDGYEFEGWYASKSADGVYSDKWDFDSNTVREGEEVTLYANWVVPVRHSYKICYLDEKGEKVVIDSLYVDEGATCNMVLVESYAAAQLGGCTIIDYYDADGNLWDESFVHPGGEENVAIEVYVKYVKGDYNVVKTPNDFAFGNIYLARDVDMEGAKLNLSYFTSGIFEGNGHTVSNFTIDYSAGKYDAVADFYDDSLKCFNISLFGELENATISNVTFSNFKVDVSTTYSGVNKIYVCPLSGTIKQSTLTNVKAIDFTFTYSKLPSGFIDGEGKLDESKLVIVKDKFACVIDDKTKISGDSVVQEAVAPKD